MTSTHCRRYESILNRRHFLERAGGGMGMLALANLLDGSARGAAGDANPLAPRQPHFAPKATSIIWLFMEGGNSAVELLDRNQDMLQQDVDRVDIKQDKPIQGTHLE